MNKYLLFIYCWLISGCFEQQPPDGYEAVIPSQISSPYQGCPNLIDTYLLSSDQGVNLPLSKNQKQFTYFIIESLVSRDYIYRLRMDTILFTRAARTLRENEPKKYYVWRDKVLRLKDSPEKIPTLEQLSTLGQLGPLFETHGHFHSYECKDGWAKAWEITKTVRDDKTESDYIQQDDVWLARDKEGNLLIHTISYKEESTWTFWAASGGGARLIRINDRWDKMPKAPDENFPRTWSATDLPPIPKPPEKTGDCKLPKDIDGLFQRFAQKNDSFIKRFEIQPPTIKDNACAQSSVIIEFSDHNTSNAKARMKLLENDPVVEFVELLEVRILNGKLYYLVQAYLVMTND